VTETGVSLVYTVRALDAGPVIACERVEIDDSVKVLYILYGEIIDANIYIADYNLHVLFLPFNCSRL